MAHRGLEAGKGKVATGSVCQGSRQGKPVGVAGHCRGFERRSTRITEAEQLGGFVERFADGIVDGAAESDIIANTLDRQQLAVATRYQQQQLGKVWRVGKARA